MTTTTRRPPRISLATIAVVLAMSGGVLTACGSNDDQRASSTSALEVHAAASTTKQSAQTALYSAMRSLWAQHMEWTYATVVAFASDSPALEPTINRLLRNQTDIGNAVATYYGTDAGKQLTDLLTTHIKDAVPVLTAARAGDTDALNKAVEQWYANAQDIADFLASANPHWKQDDMRQMMRAHITQTIGYASDVLGGKYASAVQKYDEAEAHMTAMADVLSQGLIKQFPKKF